jgi:hypothetical protein
MKCKFKFIFFLSLFISFNVSGQSNLNLNNIIQLIAEYSYTDEIRYLKKKRSYPVIDKLEKIVLRDSIWILLSKNEIKEFSILFLKKKAIGIYGMKTSNKYLSNMRLWPGDLSKFCINSIKNYDPECKLTMSQFLNYYTDYICVKDLVYFPNKQQNNINKELLCSTNKCNTYPVSCKNTSLGVK